MRDQCWNEPQLKDFHGYLYTVNNGCMDVEGFIDSEYGKETARRLLIRSRIEYDHEEAKRYYASIGLKKEYFDWEDYYDRWTLLTPMNMEEGKVYPLVFWNSSAEAKAPKGSRPAARILSSVVARPLMPWVTA